MNKSGKNIYFLELYWAAKDNCLSIRAEKGSLIYI